MPNINLLPDSRAKQAKQVKMFKGINWVPTFCANCGLEGKWTPEDSTFFYWMCDKCYQKLGDVAGTYAVPDEIFFEEVRQVQIEEFGRELSAPELVEALKDSDNPLSKLARSKKQL